MLDASPIAPPAGIVGWWPGDGNANDIVGHDNGTLQNGASFTTGEVAQAFSFNGGGVVAPNAPQIDLTGDLTIEAWVDPSSTATGIILAKGDGNDYTDSYQLRYGGSDDQKLMLVVSDGGTTASYYTSLSGVVPVGVFSHVAVTIAGTTARLYVNGAEVLGQYTHGSGTDTVEHFTSASSLTASRYSDGGSLRIGRRADTFAPFDGVIDEATIYNRALSAAEIQAIYNAGSAGKIKPPYTWTGAGPDALWSDGSNWEGGTAPGAGADLVFPSGAQQLASQDDLGVSFSSISTSDNYEFSASGSLATKKLIVQQGSLELDSPATVTGTLSVMSAASLTVGANASLDDEGDATVEANAELDNDGTLAIGDGATLIVSTSAVFDDERSAILAANGTLAIDGRAIVGMSATLDDEGSITISDEGALDDFGQVFVGSEASLTVTQGLLLVAAGASVSVAGSMAVDGDASLDDEGTLTVMDPPGGGTLTLATDSVMTVGENAVLVSDGTVDAQGAVLNSGTVNDSGNWSLTNMENFGTNPAFTLPGALLDLSTPITDTTPTEIAQRKATLQADAQVEIILQGVHTAGATGKLVAEHAMTSGEEVDISVAQVAGNLASFARGAAFVVAFATFQADVNAENAALRNNDEQAYVTAFVKHDRDVGTFLAGVVAAGSVDAVTLVATCGADSIAIPFVTLVADIGGSNLYGAYYDKHLASTVAFAASVQFYLLTSGGSLSGSGPGGTFNVTGSGSATLSQGGIVSDGDAITVAAGATFDVSGTLTEGADGELDAFGTVTIEPNAVLDDLSHAVIEAGGTLNDNGAATVESGVAFDVFGTLAIGDTGSLNVYGSVIVAASGVYASQGAVTVEPGGKLKLTPMFTGLIVPAITYGTATTTVAGQLKVNGGQTVPAGETVQVTLDGITQDATLLSDDSFETSFATGSLHVVGAPYSISISYAGDGNFTAAFATTALTVTPAPLTIAADDKCIVYGAPIPTLTASYSGFVNGDTPASLTILPTLSTTATDSSPLGSYPINVSGAADPDYRISYVIGTLLIEQMLVMPDPLYPGQNALFVGGTSGNDHIQFKSVHTGDDGENHVRQTALEVEIRSDKFRFDQVVTDTIGRIAVYGGAGNDRIEVDRQITIPAWLFGGDGNDKIEGGGGTNLLVGGDGNDILIGGPGREVMIGGRGRDILIGLGGDDLMIAGYTAFDSNNAALAAVLAEWTSDHDYATRIANLLGLGSDTRLNEEFFLTPGSTVFDDGSPNLLVGGSGLDWFLANLSSDRRDRDVIASARKGETRTDLNV